MEEILRQIWGGRDVKSVMEDIQERSLLHQPALLSDQSNQIRAQISSELIIYPLYLI
jgi:hypothetical protein